MNFFKSIFTGKDNQTYDGIRIVGIITLMVYLGLAISSFVTGKPFDGMAFGTGFGATVVSVGAALKLKESTEPGAAPQDPSKQ